MFDVRETISDKSFRLLVLRGHSNLTTVAKHFVKDSFVFIHTLLIDHTADFTKFNDGPDNLGGVYPVSSSRIEDNIEGRDTGSTRTNIANDGLTVLKLFNILHPLDSSEAVAVDDEVIQQSIRDQLEARLLKLVFHIRLNDSALLYSCAVVICCFPTKPLGIGKQSSTVVSFKVVVDLCKLGSGGAISPREFFVRRSGGISSIEVVTKLPLLCFPLHTKLLVRLPFGCNSSA